MTSVLTDDIRVSPSGLARATCWLPILPEAPATLSTTTGWPSLGDSFSATKRAMMSGPVPGVNGTTMRTGWSGQAKAAGRGQHAGGERQKGTAIHGRHSISRLAGRRYNLCVFYL